ncbi:MULTISPECIES: HAD family hydrolase [unclassified Dysgonomonas]|uniref:HAD family hydrolase n=1 Tax=unclassified Dysgonomonas TaxID=2630389 RepID=UPI000680198D|nr:MULTISPECIES: HAD family phosphatase [unclassified Dysgonomonas]MBD8347259.1 HAD family phosphatase [Dysgonomonas sp. HGC4]MBF0575018.1 HAD family phosphatase [Dysgonomonas sp. GY617]
MKEIKNIVFDFGGVLLDWNPRYFYKNIFKEESELNFFLNEVCNHEWNEKQDAGRSFKDGISELIIKHPQYKREIELFYTHWIDMVGGEIEENTALISELKSEYLLFGLTNWSAETFPLVYERYSFFKELDAIIVSGEENVIKPNPEIYRRLLSRCEIDSQHSLFIDDNKINIEAAQNLGFHTIHFQQGVSLRDEMKKKGIDLM